MDNLESFKNGEVRFLIATDVAARGIDVKELPFVINVTLPDKAEDYVHRVGRVGRAGAPGLAISLVATCEVFLSVSVLLVVFFFVFCFFQLGGLQELVWYHTCNNKDKCHNTRLVSKGGCAMWYNEPALLLAIEERIQGSVVELDETWTLPQRETSSAAANAEPSLLEQEKVRLGKHSQEIKPLIDGLMHLERELQIGYFLTK